MADVKLRLRELREERELSQEKLAELSGLPQQQISRLETGKAKTVPLYVLSSLVSALRIEPGEIFTVSSTVRRAVAIATWPWKPLIEVALAELAHETEIVDLEKWMRRYLRKGRKGLDLKSTRRLEKMLRERGGVAALMRHIRQLWSEGKVGVDIPEWTPELDKRLEKKLRTIWRESKRGRGRG
jgi:transcriptional regulator with XRE-family HTH domain